VNNLGRVVFWGQSEEGRADPGAGDVRGKERPEEGRGAVRDMIGE